MTVTLTIETTDESIKAKELLIGKVILSTLDRAVDYYKLHAPERQDIVEMIRENLEVKVIWEK